MRAQAEARNGGSSSSNSKRQVTKGAQHFDSMISALAARYGADDSDPPELPDAAFEPRAGPKKGAKAAGSNSNSKKRAKGDSPPDGDIPDDEFEALRAQMAVRKAARDGANSGSGSGSGSSSTAKSTSKRRK
jgi:hypothetical protein